MNRTPSAMRLVSILFCLLLLPTLLSAQWEKLPKTGESTIEGMHFFDRNVGFIAGVKGVFKTTDGGETWEESYVAGLNRNITSIDFHDRENGFMAGRSTSTFHTDNGGDIWSQLYVPNGYNSNFLTVTAASPLIAYAAGSGNYLCKTTDGGKSWTPQTSFFETIFYASESFGPDTVIMVRDRAGLVMTTNGGEEWDASPGGFMDSINTFYIWSLYGMHFDRPTHGFVVGEYTRHMESERGGIIIEATLTPELDGVDYRRMTFPDIDRINDIAFLDEKIGCAVGSAGTILMTADGGKTWTLTPSPVRNDLEIVQFVDGTAYIGATSGVLLKLTGAPTAVRTPEQSDAPGAPVITDDAVIFSTDKASSVTLYDAMGRTVRSRMESGRGSIRIDRHELPAGIYFYRIQPDGEVARSGKLLLGR